MDSYEDRIRAVKLFLKLGKRDKATIRQLGYPTKISHGVVRRIRGEWRFAEGVRSRKAEVFRRTEKRST
jgi:hypothetical protein